MMLCAGVIILSTFMNNQVSGVFMNTTTRGYKSYSPFAVLTTILHYTILLFCRRQRQDDNPAKQRCLRIIYTWRTIYFFQTHTHTHIIQARFRYLYYTSRPVQISLG